MRLPKDLVSALFLRRFNRFAGEVWLEEKVVFVHIPNSGRMQELLEEGNRCYLAPGKSSRRSTSYDLCLVDLGHTLVSVDARLPSALVAEALAKGELPQLQGYQEVKREVRCGGSRLDFLLKGSEGFCLVEVKSVTLVEDGVGLFPDAPTERGRRHLQKLMEAVLDGHRAVMLFIIQREDAFSFAPNDEADPAFSSTFRSALRLGVEAYAYTCKVSLDEVCLAHPVPVQMHR